MSKPPPGMKQIVDWSASLWAGLFSGTAFFLSSLFIVPAVKGGNVWVMVRLFASVIMGEGILAPPPTFDLTALLAAVFVNFIVSMGFAMLIAFIIHRGGLIGGIIGGGLLGLAIYGINFYTFTLFFPWFFAMRGDVMILNHVLFGALAGGIYEWLEVEEFIPDPDAEEEETL